MKVNWETSPLFYLILFSFFCLDLYSYFIFGNNVFAAVMVMLAILLARPLNVFRVIMLLFFLSLESFFFYGRSYLYLIYLIPVFIMVTQLRDRFWDSFSCMLITLLMALVGQFIILEYYLLDQPLFSFNHFLGFTVNILTLILLSMID